MLFSPRYQKAFAWALCVFQIVLKPSGAGVYTRSVPAGTFHPSALLGALGAILGHDDLHATRRSTTKDHFVHQCFDQEKPSARFAVEIWRDQRIWQRFRSKPFSLVSNQDH